jgi:hypothetical protein
LVRGTTPVLSGAITRQIILQLAKALTNIPAKSLNALQEHQSKKSIHRDELSGDILDLSELDEYSSPFILSQ